MGRFEKKPTRGGKLLEAWMDSNGLTYAGFAEKFDCSKSYVGHLINGMATPGLLFACRIDRATDNFVPCLAWSEPI